MKSIELQVSLRKNLGKKDARILRRNSQVPCVMYGGKEILHFHAHENAFKNLVYTHHVFMINLDVGGKEHQAFIKEIQFHPVTDRINHVDFMEVTSDKPVVIELPVEITGNSVGVRAGGKFRQRKRYLKVKGMLAHLPDSLVVDITDLNIGESILAGDLKYDYIEILEARHTLVVGVVSSRAAAKGMEEAPEAAAPAAEGETAAAEEAVKE
jgi:large subunit ribosomal protein L25